MFLKHQDVKQKNWRMRKVKKLFVSSCMLLTVGLGVAVPTAFSQSNGVMVVKAAEAEELPDDLMNFKGTWEVSADGSSGRFFSKGATDSYVFHLIPAKDVKKPGWREHNEVKDSYIKIDKQSIAARYKTSTTAPYSVAFKVNTKSLIKDHDYKITFEQGQIASGITVDYRIGSAFNKTTDDSFKISDESKYASNVKIEGEEQGFKQREQGDKTISFRTLKEGPMSLVLLSKVEKKPQGDLDVEFKNFKIIDVTNPSQLDKGVAYVGNKNVELTLKSDDGRTNFEGDEISLFNSRGELLQTVTVTKDQQNPISITLSEDQAKSLKNKEKLKVSIKQKQSKKTSKDFFFEVGIDPKVEAKQKEKLLELDKVKKQIEDSINGDAWLPEKPEGEKPVQNTNKELQLQELNKKYQMAKEAIESATTLDDVETQFDKYTKVGDKDKYPDSLRNQYTQGDKDKEIEKAKKSLGDLSDKVNGKIEEDKWLSAEVKKKQQQELEARKQKVNDSLKGSDSLKSLRETVEKASSKNQKKPESFEDVYVPGNEETEKTKVRDILQKTYQKTEQNIETDPWLSPEQKKAQKENAKTRLDAGLKAVETTESLDKLKEVESDFLDKEKNPDSIPNQHKAGTPEVARKTFLDNFEKEAKKEIESIKNDVTLTDAEKATAKAKVEAQLQEAKGKAKESKSFDDLKNIQDKFNSELPHTPGKPLKDQQSDAIAELEKKQQEIEKAIEGDKTLPRDEKEKQIADSKERLKSDTQKVKDAKNADAIKKAFEEGKVNIPQAHIPGDLNKDKEKLLAELKQKAADTEKAIDSDKTLTAKEKEEQKAKTKEELQKATEAVGAIDNREELDKKVPELKKAIEDTHVKGNLEGVKNKAIEDLKKVHDETVAKINGDDTLDKATKEAQVKEADKALAAGKDAITKADDADKVGAAVTEHTPKIKAAHKTGDLKKVQEEANQALDKAAEKERGEINNDITLTAKDKEQQLKEVETALTKAKDNVKAAKTADAINDARDKGVATIDAVHKAGQDLGARKSGQVAKLEEAAKATKDKISADPTLTSKEKEEQSKAVNAELKKAIEAVAKRVTAEIEADPTLTPEVREQQKAEVQKELELATDKIAEAKDADEADKAYGDGVTAIENAHVIGKGIEARKDLAKKDLAEAAAKTKALIIEDKTLTDDQRKEQLSGVDTEYAKGIENIDAAKDAAGVDKAYSDGVRDILAQYKEGQNLDDRRNAAKEFLLKEADKVTKLINDDPTLTHDQKVDQINKVEQAKLDAIKSVDDAQTADAINDALGKGIENINNQYQHGDGVDVRKATAKGDLEKEAAKVKALIAKDPTLTQADKDKQTAAVDAAKNTAIAAVDKATTADGVNQELGKGITAINKAYRPGEAVKARKEAAKADLEKEAAKVKALIAKDPTLTQADKDKQTAAVDAAKNTAIAAVDKATTAEGINQELGKGITAINKAYRPGEGVKARKEAAKADLEREAAKVREAIANDPTLTKADKAKQTEAVAKALKAAIAAVDKATTAEGINQELGKGITAINKAYRPGEGVEAHKEAAKANLEKVAKETKALISGDRYLSETEKAVQKQAVEQALAKALGQVEAAKTVEAVKLAENLGTVAIRAAYVPNKAVAKSSSANHLPKSGDANSIVLVGLGVMSLLLGMVLYSKKKESKD
ncbi:TPA: DUF1542 domain-containing protein [Streptococcus pyogenes]